MKGTFFTLGVVIALILIITIIGPALWLFQLQFWGVKYQNAQTEIYHHTDAYEMGNQRDFENLVLAYHQAKTDDEKDAILSTIRHRAYGIPPEQVPADVRSLINQ